MYQVKIEYKKTSLVLAEHEDLEKVLDLVDFFKQIFPSHAIWSKNI